MIQFSGILSIPRLTISSNKTLLGVGPNATINGGVRIAGRAGTPVRNVILRNLQIDASSNDNDGDGLQLTYAECVWVDHCEIHDAPDGNLDIVHASNWITVSWTKFWYSNPAPAEDHRFSNLIGNSDGNASEDRGRLKVTLHHNWWSDRVRERMPRVRFGQVHVFNNLYTATDNNYCIGAGLEASLLIENNYFQGVSSPHIFYNGETTAQIVARGNVYDGCSGQTDSGQGSAFEPLYPYSLDPAQQVPALVRDGAGPR